MRKIISDETWMSIVEDHTIAKKSVKQICKERGMNYRTVYYGLIRLGVTPDSNLTDRTRFYVNNEYFKSIDCENKAYILGFLITDGTISTKKQRLVLKLKESDKYILEFINKEIAGEYKISADSSTLRGKTFQSFRLEIHSPELVKQLQQLGLCTNKTSKEILPTIPDNLMSHLIRGIFDGDGSCSVRKDKIGKAEMLNVNICSTSKSFLESIQTYCGGNIYLEPRVGLNMYRLVFTSKESRFIFHDYIYKDATVYLTRKKDMYDNYVNTVLR